jgi:hypothetical protein
MQGDVKVNVKRTINIPTLAVVASRIRYNATAGFETAVSDNGRARALKPYIFAGVQ